MSSSAFFIDAAANTVRVLSCASADEWTDADRIVRATKNPAKRRIMPLRAWSRARSAHATQALVVDESDRRKRRSGCPRPAYGGSGYRHVSLQHRRVRTKAPVRRVGKATGAHAPVACPPLDPRILK